MSKIEVSDIAKGRGIIIDTQEVAGFFGKSTRTIHNYIREGMPVKDRVAMVNPPYSTAVRYRAGKCVVTFKTG